MKNIRHEFLRHAPTPLTQNPDFSIQISIALCVQINAQIFFFFFLRILPVDTFIKMEANQRLQKVLNLVEQNPTK